MLEMPSMSCRMGLLLINVGFAGWSQDRPFLLGFGQTHVKAIPARMCPSGYGCPRAPPTLKGDYTDHPTYLVKLDPIGRVIMPTLPYVSKGTHTL